MAGYVIAQIEVQDPQKYQEYVAQVPATVARYGGEFLVRGGAVEVREGEWPDRRTIVLRFESLARAREWYESPEYAGPLALRQSASVGNLVIVEGA